MDTVTVDRRIDKFLTLIFDSKLEEVVGFKIKGLRHYFNEQIQTIVEEQPEGQFIELIRVLETVIGSIGSQLCEEINQTEYKRAEDLARRNQAKVDSAELLQTAA